jgi:2,3-bisphosphoglycerate-dependent phosphoglycerate mutase
MDNIYVVRHCKAEGQAPDAPLTAAGLLQSEQLAQFLADKQIDYIVSSPFERARRTIMPLANQLGIEVVLDGRLKERVLAGKNRPDWRDMLLQTYDDLNLCYEGGESSHAAMGRAVRAVMDVLQSRYHNAVIVSHGNLISLLLKHFDHRIGFNEWEAMSSPDVYRLFFMEGKMSIQRIWRG